MAGEGEVRNDIKAHAKSYSGFIQMMKWGTIISFIVAMFVVFLIA
ncbi:MAG TPA: aa3-type cytochrome c oxidase subunit IV [Allosphingosinicella sp.]|nr:aa3-type cytochrome c oxidase subunit IV [Allosphingosinicella sp.]